MNLISVIIADDHEIFRQGLKAVLNEISFVKVVAEANNGCQLLKIVKKEKPDIILMDIRMPQLDGIEATRKIHEAYPGIGIIGLTSYEDISYFNGMLKSGALGFLLKNTSKEELEQAILSVAEGKSYFSEEFRYTTEAQKHTARENLKLTKREQEVLELICKGMTNAEIADNLGISVKTVDGHRMRLMEKTGAKNAANLVHFAYKNGLIDG